MYDWLHTINPGHYIMAARVKNVVKKYPDKKFFCIHGADHNYWYYKSLKTEKDIELVYPLRQNG